MSIVMLTARNATSGSILDLTALPESLRERMHGRKTARHNGIEPVCKHCAGGVHLVVNHHGRAFWRHDAGTARTCLLAEVGGGESEDHVGAKAAITGALRALTGWSATPEERFERDGDVVVVDVYATPDRSEAHRVPTAWEVQLSTQSYGEFMDRTAQRRRVADCRTAWVTPHGPALRDVLGVVSNSHATQIIDRIYESPYSTANLPPISLDHFVRGVAAKRPKLLWSQSGQDGEWIAYPSNSVGNVPVAESRRSERRGNSGDEDRACDRPGASAERPPGEQLHLDGIPFRCEYCGLTDASIKAWFKPKPCHRCADHFSDKGTTD